MHNRRIVSNTLLRLAVCVAIISLAAREPHSAAQIQPSTQVDFDALAGRVDPYTPKQRVLVLTDIANEPDDQMSMVRFLVYSNGFDVEGLVATTSTWMRNKGLGSG